MYEDIENAVNAGAPLEGETYLGIDIGTTSISAAVTDGERTVTFSVPNGCARKAEGFCREQDARGIADRVSRLVELLIDRYPATAGIGFDGQMHGIVYVDRTGRAVSDLITWQDGRGDAPAKSGEAPCKRISRLTGYKIYTGYGMATHMYNTDCGIIPRGAVKLCTIGDYAAMRLCGAAEPVIHPSNAASLGLFDPASGSFDRFAVDAAGMDPAFLPEVSHKVSPLGKYRGIPVYIAVGDNQAAYYGVMREGGVLCNFGTGSQISVAVDGYREIPGVECRPYLDGKYILSGSALCGGRAYAALERFFRAYVGGEEPQYKRLDLLAEEGYAAGASLEVTPLFCGTREDPSLRGSITGIDEQNFTPAALAYGTLRGMVNELYGYFKLMDLPAPAEVTASGNAVRKGVTLQKVIADVFGCPVRVSTAKEEAACGAALLAMNCD